MGKAVVEGIQQLQRVESQRIRRHRYGICAQAFQPGRSQAALITYAHALFFHLQIFSPSETSNKKNRFERIDPMEFRVVPFLYAWAILVE
jgi:hypothetical protein